MYRDTLPGQSVLITGGAGFIGSHLADRLMRERVSQVVLLDNLFLGDADNIRFLRAAGASFYRDDAEFIDVLDALCTKHDITTVFNCATKALNYSFFNPRNAFDTNTQVVLNLLELQRRGRFKTLCQLSSSEVYGSAVYQPMDEHHPRNPTTTYAAGKAAADLALESYVRMFDIDAYIIRPFNNYGPRQNYRGALAGVIPATIRNIRAGKAPVIFGDGRQLRDFIYVRDTVDAIVAVHDRMRRGDAVNLTTEFCITIEELIKSIAEAMGFAGEIVRGPPRNADVHTHRASGSKLRSLIDLTHTPFEQGLRETVDWQLEHMDRAGDDVW